MITLHDLSTNLLKSEYAVRGPIVGRAQQLEQQGRKIIYCNIGNPQALKQRPLTYLRQLLALLEYPALMDDAAAVAHFPADVAARASPTSSRSGTASRRTGSTSSSPTARAAA